MTRKLKAEYEYITLHTEEAGVRDVVNRQKFWSVSEAPDTVWADDPAPKEDKPDSLYKEGEWVLYVGECKSVKNPCRIISPDEVSYQLPSHYRVWKDASGTTWNSDCNVLTPHPTGLGPWQEKHYPIPASEVSKEGAAAHSLLKFEGARPEVLERYGLQWYFDGGDPVIREISNRGARFAFGYNECALCRQYAAQGKVSCAECPLALMVHEKCLINDDGPYSIFYRTGNPEPMISALQAVVDAEKQCGIDGKGFVIKDCKVENCTPPMPKFIKPPEPGPWENTHRWDGKVKRFARKGDACISKAYRTVGIASCDEDASMFYVNGERCDPSYILVPLDKASPDKVR